MTDANVNKLIIVTQTPPPPSRHIDRAGNSNIAQKRSDVKLNDEMEHGLRRYEEELWSIEGKNVSLKFCLIMLFFCFILGSFGKRRRGE